MIRHGHLHGHRIEVIKGEIVVFEPARMSSDWMSEVALPLFKAPEGPELRGGRTRWRVRYSPVMKFVPLGERNGYSVYRMTYRGGEGWSWPLASGSLHELLKQFLGCVGTDEFFELL